MNMQPQFQLRFVPWVTLGLFVVVWTNYLSSIWSGSSVAVRDSWGLDFDNAVTFLTYALIHDGLYHITLNTISLLLFGSVVELQVGRMWYCAIVTIGILAGVAGALLLHSVTGMIPDNRLVGLSAGTYALTIVAIGVVVRHWHWDKWTFRVTLIFVTLVLISSISGLWQTGLQTLWDPSVALAVILGIGTTCYCLFRGDSRVYELAPTLWAFILLMADLLDMGWSYATMGHLGGLTAGALLMPATLRGRTPTPGTTWLKGGLQDHAIWWWGTVRRVYESRRFVGGVLVALLVILVVLVSTTDYLSAVPE